MTLFKLAIKSLLDRRASVVLAVISMAVSVSVLLGVEHVRYQAKTSFASTVSGVDLIVGARTSSMNLLLYSVFRIGAPTNNIQWQSFQTLANHPDVRWAVPLSLGDSHKGFRVLGTSQGYFEHYQFGAKKSLNFSQGVIFNDVFDVVLGANVARALGYSLGDTLVLSHGIGGTSFTVHDTMPFTVVGILAPTGTPVDETLHVSLQGIEAVHAPHNKITPDRLVPKQITAAMLGLRSKMSTFRVQREINLYADEPLTAVLPGVALSELWQVMSVLENSLWVVSILVFVSACLGVGAMLVASIRARQREIHLLRMIGASPATLFWLVELEALIITVAGVVIGLVVTSLGLVLLQDELALRFGLQMSPWVFNAHTGLWLSAMVGVSMIAATIPSLVGYLRSKQ